MKQLLTAAEVAAELRMSPQVVLRWKRKGLITADIDRHAFVRFDLKTVIKQLAAKPQTPSRTGMVPTF